MVSTETNQLRTARISLRDDIVEVRVLAGMAQTLADAEANIAAAIVATGGPRKPVLVDISEAVPLTPEVRRLYSGHRLTDAFSALGLLVRANPVGRMLGNIYFRIAKPDIPIMLFDSEAKALEWLRSHL